MHKSFVFGCCGFGILMLIVIFGPLVFSKDYLTIDYLNILRPPNYNNLMGTDEFGRDVFARVLYGGRLSLTVGAATMVLTGVLGLTIGLLCGYFSRIDAVLMRVMDVLMSFPSLMLAMALMASLGSTITNVVIALSLAYTPRTARVIRSLALAIREETYIEAAYAVGCSTFRIIFRHILPQVLPVLAVQQTFIFAYAVLGEAGLSFVGIGIQPPAPSWGNIIGDARPFLHVAPWMVFFPGGAIVSCVLFLNLIGDGLREMLDPRRKRAQM